jgi:tetratricopeptide (TPR) repeat protein
MKFTILPLVFVVTALAGRGAAADSPSGLPAPWAGSTSCRSCHASFYQRWVSSHHGLAMQPYTPDFACANLKAATEPIRIGKYEYLACLGPKQGWVRERGPEGERQYRIVHVLGGKSVYYFLTPLDRGRLQTLPVAYDVRTQKWFDTAASGVRHFPAGGVDAPAPWTDPMFTFNTSCHGCHVSQLSTNYDPQTDTYRTTWAEPGINCEACHGPAQEHVRICRAAGAGQTPRDLKIISIKSFPPEQINSMCSSCHAKMSPLSTSFQPGERYFDRFDLTTLEYPDFYPDGRDLGENYTMTTWRLSPCVRSGKLDCLHCHTSSGRYRFAGNEKPNAACLPCHQERVENAAVHTHHQADSAGNRCTACHMPRTDFARMARSDHSMRPPTPAATLAFKSPNACNACHKDKGASWADQQVRQWHQTDYQKPVLERAGLLDAIRRGDWHRLGDALAYIESKNRDEVFATSLIRLLQSCESSAKWPALIHALQEDPSPLVRSAAAQTLEGYASDESVKALAKATTDDYRLVRVRAASALAAVPVERVPDACRTAVSRATTELLEAYYARPDDYASQYNLGNFYLQRGDQSHALASYQTAIRLRPDFVPPYANVAFIYNAIGQNDQAEASFRRAIALEPNDPVLHLNLGMLLGEMKRPAEAEQAFRKTLALDPNSAVAAYNLGILLALERPRESLPWLHKAYRLRPDEGKYGYTYAFYLRRQRQADDAVKVLRDMMGRDIPYADVYALLGQIYLARTEVNEAISVYQAASHNANLPQSIRDDFRAMIRQLEGGL